MLICNLQSKMIDLHALNLCAILGLSVALFRSRQTIARLRIDPAYGIQTRAAVEFSPPKKGMIIFWDIDRMRELNARWGYEEVDRRISAATYKIRLSHGCSLIARWYSGDEFIYNCSSLDAERAARRIHRLFSQQEIAVTIGIASIENDGWREAVRRACKTVQDAKRRGDRGTIHK